MQDIKPLEVNVSDKITWILNVKLGK
jgi:hypothetical protein